MRGGDACDRKAGTTMLEDMQEWTCSECGWFSYTQADGKDADAQRFCQNCGSEVL